MNNMINEKVIEFAERLQLPERAININDLPWVPFKDNGSIWSGSGLQVPEHSCLSLLPIREDLVY